MNVCRMYPPFKTPCAARNIIAVKADENITFCPEFKYANEVAIFRADFSYALRCLSY